MGKNNMPKADHIINHTMLITIVKHWKQYKRQTYELMMENSLNGL